MSTTLLAIRTAIRQRTDMEQSQFVRDPELNGYINSSLQELHDLLVAAYCEDYYMSEYDFTTTAGVKSYVLPTDFYKLRGVDVQNGSQWATVKRFNFNRRNQDQNSQTWNLLGLPYLEYRLVGSNVLFNRAPTAPSNIRLFYYPKAIQLVADTDIYDDFNGYAEYIIADCCIKCLAKEESDTQVYAMQKQGLHDRLTVMAQNRDANEPESVTDIYAEDQDAYLGGSR